jgi:hypothetical protein
MTKLSCLAIALFASFLAACGGDTGGQQQANVVEPYETCDDTTDVCDQGLSCLPTTLPVATGYTGELCTSTCQDDSDCAQDLSNFASICVNGQCYTQCPDGGANCPYGTSCLEFNDDAGNAIDICSP